MKGFIFLLLFFCDELYVFATLVTYVKGLFYLLVLWKAFRHFTSACLDIQFFIIMIVSIVQPGIRRFSVHLDIKTIWQLILHGSVLTDIVKFSIHTFNIFKVNFDTKMWVRPRLNIRCVHTLNYALQPMLEVRFVFIDDKLYTSPVLEFFFSRKHLWRHYNNWSL